VEEFDSFEGHHEFSIPINEFKTMGLPELLEKLDRLAQELFERQNVEDIRQPHRICDRSRPECRRRGKPFSAEAFTWSCFAPFEFDLMKTGYRFRRGARESRFSARAAISPAAKRGFTLAHPLR